MPFKTFEKNDVQQILSLLKQRLDDKDPGVISALQTSAPVAAGTATTDQLHTTLSADVNNATAFVHAEDFNPGEDFHSRNGLAGLAQAHLNAAANQLAKSTVGDALPAVVDLYGEGNPIVWAPVMVNILLEHLLPKAPFVTATEARSYIQIPNQ